MQNLIRYAKRQSPETRVILISGNASDAVRLEGAERGAAGFLPKPFEIGALDAMLNTMSSPPLFPTTAAARVIRMPLLDEIVRSEALNPFFQPIVALSDGWLRAGYESLARYRAQSPFRNPEVLFKYAERKQRLPDLELACMHRTFQAAARLPKGTIFLNVHPEVFSEGQRLCRALEEGDRAFGLPLDGVILEITEQSCLAECPALLETFSRLEALGVRFAFDDLGIAFSHLPLIDKIRPSFLKVSQHFGTGFESDATKMRIVANLLSLARDFHCDLILEGIENVFTARAAAALGIPYGQGFFFGMPAEAALFGRVGSGERQV